MLPKNVIQANSEFQLFAREFTRQIQANIPMQMTFRRSTQVRRLLFAFCPRAPRKPLFHPSPRFLAFVSESFSGFLPVFLCTSLILDKYRLNLTGCTTHMGPSLVTSDQPNIYHTCTVGLRWYRPAIYQSWFLAHTANCVWSKSGTPSYPPNLVD